MTEEEPLSCDFVGGLTLTCESNFTGREAESFYEDNNEYDLVVDMTGEQGHCATVSLTENESGEQVVCIEFYVDEKKEDLLGKWCQKNNFSITS